MKPAIPAFIVLAAALWVPTAVSAANAPDPGVNLHTRLGDVEIVRHQDQLQVRHRGRLYSSQDYLALLRARQAQRDAGGPAYRLLNITTAAGVAWVGLGLLGQILFTARMAVQWLASEKKRRSVVPPVFWYLSLAGATMLLAYFVWRKDAVGVLGQATGWAIYARNLYLIRRAPPTDPSP